MTEAEISIIHHGRDRENIVDKVFDTNPEIHGCTLTLQEKSAVSRLAIHTIKALTPPDETRIRKDSILKYIDVSKVKDPEFEYGFEDIQAALQRLLSKPQKLEPEIRSWLESRGVTAEQLKRFRSFSEVESRRDRVCLGIETHPSLKAWIGDPPLAGVILPVISPEGNATGCHLRFLSTVPKIKFGASCPGIHVSSNWKPNQNLWLVEGIFDGLALDSLGEFYASPSSGAWSCEQLFILISIIKRYRVKRVLLAHDNDRVGSKENLFLYSVLKPWTSPEFLKYPQGAKDMSELVFKCKQDPRELGGMSLQEAAEKYFSLPYQKIIDYDHYLGHRQDAYANDKYHWL